MFNRYVTFVLSCVYRSSSSSTDDDKILVDFIMNVSNTYEKSFIFGDFNMSDISWPLNTSQSHNAFFQLLVELLINSHLNQLVLKATRYTPNQTHSPFDLIISSDDNSLVNLVYLTPIGKSDHVTL